MFFFSWLRSLSIKVLSANTHTHFHTHPSTHTHTHTRAHTHTHIHARTHTHTHTHKHTNTHTHKHIHTTTNVQNLSSHPSLHPLYSHTLEWSSANSSETLDLTSTIGGLITSSSLQLSLRWWGSLSLIMCRGHDRPHVIRLISRLLMQCVCVCRSVLYQLCHWDSSCTNTVEFASFANNTGGLELNIQNTNKRHRVSMHRNRSTQF